MQENKSCCGFEHPKLPCYADLEFELSSISTEKGSKHLRGGELHLFLSRGSLEGPSQRTDH